MRKPFAKGNYLWGSFCKQIVVDLDNEREARWGNPEWHRPWLSPLWWPLEWCLEDDECDDDDPDPDDVLCSP